MKIFCLVCSNDKILRIFDLEQPSEPIVKFEGHTAGIKQVAILKLLNRRFKVTVQH